jgi:peptidyl-tRNA hydrolase
MKKNPQVGLICVAVISYACLAFTARPALGEYGVKFKFCIASTQVSVNQWIRQAKIALKATSEGELLELEAIAKSLNLCARSIQDQSASHPLTCH